MTTAALKVILMPGMDGSGDLFTDFIAALPAEYEKKIVQYPADQELSYAGLEPLVRSMLPDDAPFILVAESYSSPLAIRIASTHPKGLLAIALCAGFATSPLKGVLHDLSRMLPLRAFRPLFPGFMTRMFLLGDDAPDALVTAVAAEIDWVEPTVLAARVREVLMVDVRAELAEVRVPIQYLRAARDKLVDVECMEEIVTIQPSTAVATIDAPHLLLQREPQICARVIAEFMQMLQSGERIEHG